MLWRRVLHDNTRQKSGRQTVLERRDTGFRVSCLFRDLKGYYITLQLCRSVNSLKHLIWQGWMQLHAHTVYLGWDVDRHTCTAAVDIENSVWGRKTDILSIEIKKWTSYLILSSSFGQTAVLHLFTCIVFNKCKTVLFNVILSFCK